MSSRSLTPASIPRPATSIRRRQLRAGVTDKVELAEPGKEFTVYRETRLKRVPRP